MKLKIWDRILIALSGLMILFISICVFVYGIGIFPFQLDISFLSMELELWHRVVIVAAAMVLFALSIHHILMLFRRNRDKGFIIQHTEYGNMSISMNALESMVKKCVDSHAELSVSSTKIHRGRDGIAVEIKITLLSGVNIPLTVNALQKQIKQYITSCSGVDVYQVRVMVETTAAQPVKILSERVDDPIHVTETKPMEESITPKQEIGADQIFSHTEEPERCPEPAKVDLPDEPQEVASALADEAEPTMLVEPQLPMETEEATSDDVAMQELDPEGIDQEPTKEDEE